MGRECTEPRPCPECELKKSMQNASEALLEILKKLCALRTDATSNLPLDGIKSPPPLQS